MFSTAFKIYGLPVLGEVATGEVVLEAEENSSLRLAVRKRWMHF
jgi:hypothetical protein